MVNTRRMRGAGSIAVRHCKDSKHKEGLPSVKAPDEGPAANRLGGAGKASCGAGPCGRGGGFGTGRAAAAFEVD